MKRSNWNRAAADGSGIVAALAALVAALLCPAAALCAEPDLRGELQRRAAEKGLSPQQSQALLQRLDRVQAADLPLRPVADRYLEGLARGVEFTRLEAAVDRLETRMLESARRVDLLFPPGAGSGTERATRWTLIDHCTYALAAGVPPQGIEQVMHLAADGNQGPAEGKAAVLAVGCLVAGGIEPGTSVDLVRTAWTHGYRGADLEHLGRDLGSLGSGGQGPPPEVLRRVREVIAAGGDRRDLFRHLEDMRGNHPPGPGQHPPGMHPGGDPSMHRGPGGPPQDPGHMGPHGGHPHPRP
jgi:hypothetical protein